MLAEQLEEQFPYTIHISRLNVDNRESKKKNWKFWSCLKRIRTHESNTSWITAN